TALSSIALTLFTISASAQVCDPPAGTPQIFFVQSTSATATWDASPDDPNGVEYNWEVRTSGAGGSGQAGLQASGATANGLLTTNMINLEFDTNYIFYVNYECGTEDESAWVASALFTTNTL